jgi:hypothetical protein
MKARAFQQGKDAAATLCRRHDDGCHIGEIRAVQRHLSRCVDTVESSSRLTAIFMVFISAITLTER